NRSALTGVGITQLGAPPDTSQDEVEQSGQLGIINRVVQVKLGEQQYAHLKRILDRAGLFLWATARGDFVLSAPNARQRPTYRIERQRGNDRNAVNVTNARFKNETTPRFSEALIFARGGGRKFGRQNTAGQFVDDEMVALGYKRPLVFKDANVSNPEQAEF